MLLIIETNERKAKNSKIVIIIKVHTGPKDCTDYL